MKDTAVLSLELALILLAGRQTPKVDREDLEHCGLLIDAVGVLTGSGSGVGPAEKS